MKDKLLVLEGAKITEIKEINKASYDEAIRLVFDNGYKLEIPKAAQEIILIEPNYES